MIRKMLLWAMLAFASLIAGPAYADNGGAGGAAFAALSKLSIVAQPSFEERLIREGETFSSSGNTLALAVATGSVSVVAAQAPMPIVNKTVWIDNIYVSLDKPALVQISLVGINKFQSLTPIIIHPGTGPVAIPIRQMFRAYQVFTTGANAANGASANIQILIRNNLTAGSVTYNAAVSLSGWLLTDDINWGAKKTLLVAGDSTENGRDYSASYISAAFQARDYYKAKGEDVRVLLKSLTSSTSTDHELYRKGGWYDVGQVNLALYQLGINEALQSIPASTYVANLTSYWTSFHAQHPSAPLVVLGPAPLQDTSNESRAAAIRTAGAAYVSSVNSPLLKYINLGTAFTATDSSNYTDGIHRNDTGENAVAATLVAGLTAQQIRLAQ